MSRLHPHLCALLLWSCAASAVAQQALPVDDSASEVLSVGALPMRWDAPLPRAGQPDTISGRVQVRARLDVSPWRGRNGRVYLRLAALPIGPVDVEWTARGPLLPGRLRDGERALVYAGPIDTTRLEDTLLLTLRADGHRVLRQERLDFSFEIELESP